MPSLITLEEILRLAREKCRTDSELSNRSGVSRSHIWKLRSGKLKGTARQETIGKLVRVILDD